MVATRIYMDYAASAPLRAVARDKMVECLDLFGNPSSVHAEGQAARLVLDEARRTVGNILDVRAERVVFTSGATEANNLALRGVMAKVPGKRVLVSAVEHDCVRNTGLALGAEFIPVDGNGLVDLAWLKAELARGDVALVSVMFANNENGVVQDVAAVAGLCKAAGVIFHCDAVQAVGHVPVVGDVADLVSMSAHKFGGPRGAGVLIVKSELEMDAVVTGGAQERNRRAGTENLAAVAGMAAALEAAVQNMAAERMAAAEMALALEDGMRGLGVEIVGAAVERIGHILQIITPGKRGEDVVIGMDMRGVAVSQGSACGSGKVKESHVLQAMGYGSRAGEAIRLSWGWDSKVADAGAVVAAIRAFV